MLHKDPQEVAQMLMTADIVTDIIVVQMMSLYITEGKTRFMQQMQSVIGTKAAATTVPIM